MHDAMLEQCVCVLVRQELMSFVLSVDVWYMAGCAGIPLCQGKGN
jgi:hypothetical protein